MLRAPKVPKGCKIIIFHKENNRALSPFKASALKMLF